jgi:two-component system, chemotaxis family, sensor kinase Cph1
MRSVGIGSSVGIMVLAGTGLAGITWGWAVAEPSASAGGAIALGGLALGAAAGAVARRSEAPLAPAPRRTSLGATGSLPAARREGADGRAELDAIHSAVSHDLRSPIGAVLNFLTVLEEDHGAQLDADGRAILTRIRRSADSALTLLDGLARLASAARSPMAPRLVDVDSLVRDAFAAARPAEDRTVELTVLGPLPPVVGDPELLRTAFEELLANAIKFSAPREEARIKVGAAGEDGTVAYWIADEGVGFDPRFAGKLFHIFERLHSREEFPGAGAGLAVVHRIAERHGGRVAAEGEPERGATFRLVLPAAPEGAAVRSSAS